MKDLGYMFKFLQGNFSGHLHIVNVRVGVYTRVAMLYSLYIVVAVSRFIHRSSTFSHEGSQKSESCNRNVRRVLVCTYVRTYVIDQIETTIILLPEQKRKKRTRH